MAPNKKLGKGLSSLLGNKNDLSFDKKNDNGLLLIPIENIFRDENQPRKEFDKEKIEELAQSIDKNGLIQPSPSALAEVRTSAGLKRLCGSE